MEPARILIVDDEADSLELLKFHLQRVDREIEAFLSPAEAMEAIRAGGWDVVITDVAMPGHDGFDVIRAVREREPVLPCIVVTGVGTHATVENALEADCFGYVSKPFEWSSFHRLIDRAVQSIRRYRRCASDRDSGQGRNPNSSGGSHS